MRPLTDANLQSNIPGLFLAGSLIDAQCIRVAQNQGHRIAKHIAGLVRSSGPRPAGFKDLIIVGSGPAGLSAGLSAKNLGLDVLVVDQYFLAATILAMPAGKVFDVNYMGNNEAAEGPLWFENSPAPVLHAKWMDQVKESGLAVIVNDPVTGIRRDELNGQFNIITAGGTYQSSFVLLCIGKAGAPRRLEVPGEAELYGKKRLHYSYRGPGTIHEKDILVVGGGNTAVEAVIGLAQDNHVTISYRQPEFSRLTPKNYAALEMLSNKGSIHVMLNSHVVKFQNNKVVFDIKGETVERTFNEHFILIGFELPMELLKNIGVMMA